MDLSLRIVPFASAEEQDEEELAGGAEAALEVMAELEGELGVEVDPLVSPLHCLAFGRACS